MHAARHAASLVFLWTPCNWKISLP